MHPNTEHTPTDTLLASLSDRLATIVRTLSSWTTEHPRTLADIETHVLRLTKDLVCSLLSGLTALTVPTDPPSTLPCSCGSLARFQRIRPARVISTLGRISIPRPYYLCSACSHGFAPLDADLQFCAGSRSPALDELLALLGATQDSFAQAASVLDRLTLLHLSPMTVLDATETLGSTLVAHQAHEVALLQAGHDTPTVSPRSSFPSRSSTPSRLYISMDGVFTHLHERGWSEMKVGACYQTITRRSGRQTEQLEVHACDVSYISALCDAETFGWHMWQEAARRGVQSADEVVVVADGAHWIWNIAETHFPGATQIVDWYHATSYLWAAAKAVWRTEEEQSRWAGAQMTALWEGKVEAVLADLRRVGGGQEAVLAAVSYYTTHRGRMDYAAYRARGLQIGSGTIESGCKQVVSERLKGAGMVWSAEGGEGVAVVRAWLKSERWEEAMKMRKVAKRGYVRKEQGACAGKQGAQEARREQEEAEASGEGSALSAEMLASIRAEMRPKKEEHPWRKRWSLKQQQRQGQTRTA